MCLLVFAFRAHPEYPLIFAGNRDEFHGRPTAPAGFWNDHSDLLAGKDLQAGGTWLGITTGGRFATVTNFREPDTRPEGMRSRGELVVNHLTRPESPVQFLDDLRPHAMHFSGFNLILGHRDGFYYFSNRNGEPRTLKPGIYGLSNGLLDTPWPKVRRAKELFEEVLRRRDVEPDDLLGVLHDDVRPHDALLPHTGVGAEWERVLSSIFISGALYGTRASTVVTIHESGEIRFVERSFGPEGMEIGTRHFNFSIQKG